MMEARTLTRLATTSSRLEDMSSTGELILTLEVDGDIIVEVIDGEGRKAHVEFCASGGGSPETKAALVEVLKAMRRDFCSTFASPSRKGRYQQ